MNIQTSPNKYALIPESTCTHAGTLYALAILNGEKYLYIDGDADGFREYSQSVGEKLYPLISENAAALRERLPWLRPQPLGLAVSFGFGDRLGSATPGHIAAVQGTGVAPVFAQQSVRENTRTGRSPQQVLDDAVWGIFGKGWRAPWGADADHVKEINDLPPFIEAGYTFFTIDPNQYVDIDTNLESIPWKTLGTTYRQLAESYCQDTPAIKGFDEQTLRRALLKYGRAIAHVKSVSDYLVAELGAGNFDLEMSVDETDTPTTAQEHYLIANELRRLGVPFVSLAPRFIGSFEKGVDYVGDLTQFDIELRKHAAVMHTIGGYKISIHTGSDKFSIYPSIAKQAHNLVHVKTAGTSYLESLRVLASVDKPLFRQIFDFCRSHYEIDRVTYHVSGMLEKVPDAAALEDNDLLDLFTQFDARQVMHVTFGSVLDTYGSKLKEILNANADLYQKYLKEHFDRHLEPFVRKVD